jgi:hypothetical protein
MRREYPSGRDYRFKSFDTGNERVICLHNELSFIYFKGCGLLITTGSVLIPAAEKIKSAVL